VLPSLATTTALSRIVVTQRDTVEIVALSATDAILAPIGLVSHERYEA
jgi:hypothetical protein